MQTEPLYCKQEEYYIFFTRPNMEINTKMHWLELSTMIHVVRKQFSDRVTVLVPIK